ncbi:MAG: type I site-specific restriction-modification system HsdS family specificity subunit [Roseibaca calidilacus]|uniref:Type I restriction enzyme, S subunit n=1 Tax=Roseibaca calidilacus TaxID=1666912 RepID=A0A0P7YUJ7_9RHOB|nr:restriction endonuclease subunit S [Roseibaca calidilacus]KPP94170.1 MAG: type I site-specific restriction-modification system HsdS family specificity subunit [Roseibaca calidilacus]CUX81436.1 type I restriction enzyme, S subunit [Roseibaca calidilacus]
MTELPEGWISVQLRDLGKWQGGGTPSKARPEFWGGSIPWVSPKDMKTNTITTTIDRITPQAVAGSAANLVPPGSILIVTRSGILAHSFPAAVNAVEVTVNQDLKALAPSSGLSSEFIRLALKAFERAILNECVKDGTTVHSIELPALMEFEIPLPPLPEQHRIVAKIEALFSELDAGQDSLTRAQAQLKLYRQSLLKAAFQGRLTARSKNEGWPVVRLGDELVFLTSGSRGWADYYSDKGDTFIRAQNLKHDRLDLSDIAFVRLPKSAKEGTRTRVQLGDVLVTITGANVTKSGLVKNDLGLAYVSQHVALCRPSGRLRPEFLYLFLLSETGGRRQLNAAAYGAGKPGLNLENIRNVQIPLPTLQEQDAVIERVDALLSNADNLVDALTDEKVKIVALRQSILKKAFSGQLVPQDPSDEPASALLTRLRDTTPTPRRKTKA